MYRSSLIKLTDSYVGKNIVCVTFHMENRQQGTNAFWPPQKLDKIDLSCVTNMFCTVYNGIFTKIKSGPLNSLLLCCCEQQDCWTE